MGIQMYPMYMYIMYITEPPISKMIQQLKWEFKCIQGRGG